MKAVRKIRRARIPCDCMDVWMYGCTCAGWGKIGRRAAAASRMAAEKAEETEKIEETEEIEEIEGLRLAGRMESGGRMEGQNGAGTHGREAEETRLSAGRGTAENGVLIIDKPEGITSFDVVYRLRRLTGQRKIGHTGTLDPMATGVLPLLLGKAARAESLLPETWKEYEAGFRLGEETDTEDSTGKALSRCERPVSREELEEALSGFRGDILQVPPMYSALKREGKKLYELARQGIVVEREPRPVTIYALELLEYREPAREGRLRVRCSGGTYVRTLCAGIGKTLGAGGIMTSLRRTAACGFSEKEAVTLEEASALQEKGLLDGRILPVEYLFRELPALRVTEPQARRFRNGGELDIRRTALSGRRLSEGERFRVLGPEGFLGLGRAEPETGSLRVLKLF